MEIRRWHRLAAIAPLALLVAACGTGPTFRTQPKLVALPGEASTSPCGTSRADLGASNATLTREYEERLLAGLPTLPGAASLSAAPNPSLRDAPITMASSNLVSTTGWWKAPGSDISAQSYVVSHIPKGLQAAGSVGAPAEGVLLSHADTAFASQIRVLMTFAPFEDGVAERVDVQAIYWPPCPNINALVNSPTSADVTIERPSKPTVRRTIGRGPALKLVAVLKALSPALPVTIHCPAGFFGDADIVSFKTATGTSTVTADMSGCQFLNFEGHPNIALSDWAGAFNAALVRAIR